MRYCPLFFALAASAGGCTEPNPDYCDAERPCTDPATPFFDEDGAVSGATNTCIPSPDDSATTGDGDGDGDGDGPSVLRITLEGTGAGVVFSSPNGIDCGSACETAFEAGTEVTLSASPESGVSFVTWGGDCEPGFTDCRLTIDGPTAVTARFEPRGKHEFSRSIGGTDDVTVEDVVALGGRDFAVVGSFSGSFDFGDGTTRTAEGSTDAFVARYSGNELEWVRVFESQTGGLALGFGIAADDSGIVVAIASGTAVTFGQVVAKFTLAGNEVWTREVPGNLVPLTVDIQNGDIAVGGRFQGEVDFGDGPRTASAAGYVLSLSATGGFRQVFTVESFTNFDPSSDLVTSVASLENGALAFCAVSTGRDLDLGDGPLDSRGGGSDIVLAVVESNGSLRWAHRLGGAATDIATGLDFRDDSLFLTGTTEGDHDLGNGNRSPLGANQVFVASYDIASGDTRWVTEAADGVGLAGSGSITASTRASVSISGTFENRIDLGGRQFSADGFRDFFIATFSTADGRHQYSTAYGTTDDTEAEPDEAPSLATDSLGQLTVGGSHRAPISIGGAVLSPQGGENGFVGIFAP